MRNHCDKEPIGGTLHKKSILRKMFQVGGSTLLSRIFGILREILLFTFLKGAGAVSDIFVAAYRIPNSFRKIFAEGALSAAMIPTLASKVRAGRRNDINSLMSLAFLVFEGAVLTLCAFVIWKANLFIRLVAPGFSPEQILFATRLLKILMPFIFFLSSSALLAGVLQAVNKFFIPAISPALLNIVFIISILLCLTYNFPIELLCYFILLGGFIQFVLHVVTYFRLGFSFHRIDKSALRAFGNVMLKFIPCLISMSIVEISLFIDSRFASYLAKGSMSLIYLANRFMGIPLGVFGVALSTILLPHFSKIGIYAPKRLNFYLLEAMKFVFWVTVPIALIMMFVSTNIFYTFFYFIPKFKMAQIEEAGTILIAFLLGLFFFSLNKILLNMYYAFHNTWVPTIISIFATLINYILNRVLVKLLFATGIALATTISAIIQTVFFILFLRIFFDVRFYGYRFMQFLFRYVFQLAVFFSMLLFIYYIIVRLLLLLPEPIACFFISGFGFWVWISPLVCSMFFGIFYTRKLFKVDVYFLE